MKHGFFKRQEAKSAKKKEDNHEDTKITKDKLTVRRRRR